jgi:sRNA-binding carbon storage regulator CsrA
MLVLKLNLDDKVIIGEGENQVVVQFVEQVCHDKIRLGFDAPRHVVIDREKLRRRKLSGPLQAS